MKIATIFTLSIISFQAFCVDNYIEDQIKKLSSHDKEIRKDGAHRLDSYWTSIGAKTDPKEIDKYITELKKSLKDPESAVVQFITHIMGANPMVDQKDDALLKTLCFKKIQFCYDLALLRNIVRYRFSLIPLRGFHFELLCKHRQRKKGPA